MTNQINKEPSNLSNELIAVSPAPNHPEPLPVVAPPAVIQQNDAYAQLMDDINTPPADPSVTIFAILEAARNENSGERGE